MSEVRINLNEFVKVRLTDLGKDIFIISYHPGRRTVRQVRTVERVSKSYKLAEEET